MACLASNQPHVTTGAKVVWADVDPKTCTLDPESLKQKIILFQVIKWLFLEEKM
jgi:perosamine synthetase